MLYMKKRMTFRLPNDLARELRQLPNQTRFVEEALREALGMECPACAGTGRIPASLPSLPNFKDAGLPRLERGQAIQLKYFVELAGQLGVRRIEISEDPTGGLTIELMRAEAPMLKATISGANSRLETIDMRH